MSAQELYARLTFQPLALRPSALLSRVGKWLAANLAASKETRTRSLRLYISDRVSIGEKSFLSVVHVDGRRFLLANAQANVSLLTELSTEETIRRVAIPRVKTSSPRISKPRRPRAAKEGAPV